MTSNPIRNLQNRRYAMMNTTATTTVHIKAIDVIIAIFAAFGGGELKLSDIFLARTQTIKLFL